MPATFAVPHATLGEDVVTAVVLREPRARRRSRCAISPSRDLASFMVPSQIVLVPDLPRSPSGKLQRAEVAA